MCEPVDERPKADALDDPRARKRRRSAAATRGLSGHAPSRNCQATKSACRADLGSTSVAARRASRETRRGFSLVPDGAGRPRDEAGRDDPGPSCRGARRPRRCARRTRLQRPGADGPRRRDRLTTSSSRRRPCRRAGRSPGRRGATGSSAATTRPASASPPGRTSWKRSALPVADPALAGDAARRRARRRGGAARFAAARASRRSRLRAGRDRDPGPRPARRPVLRPRLRGAARGRLPRRGQLPRARRHLLLRVDGHRAGRPERLRPRPDRAAGRRAPLPRRRPAASEGEELLAELGGRRGDRVRPAGRRRTG